MQSRLGFCDELSFAVTHWKINSIHILREDARRKLMHLQVDPTVLKSSRIVECKRDRLRAVAPFDGRQKPRLYEKLKAVTYAYNHLTIIYEADQFVEKRPICVAYLLIFPLDGLCLCGT